MASLDKPSVGTSTVKWRFPDIHPEGRKYVLIAGAIALVSLFVWDFITWPLVFLTLGVAAFFRDPVRVTPQGEGLIVSPADGLITMIERVDLPPELAGPQALGEGSMLRVSVFMSVFDVHINRTPITGTIRHVIYIAGKFMNADFDKASEENERQHIIVEDRAGDMVVGGQRVGLIRFGSRVDVFIPEAYGVEVALGQRAIAGETILARKGAPRAVGIAQ
jgi:phosphatidylserine decarboxylase